VPYQRCAAYSLSVYILRGLTTSDSYLHVCIACVDVLPPRLLLPVLLPLQCSCFLSDWHGHPQADMYTVCDELDPRTPPERPAATLVGVMKDSSRG
jgi:hypothetical protein